MRVSVSTRVLWESEKNLYVCLDFISKWAHAAEIKMMPPFFPSWRTPNMKGDLDRLKDVLSSYELKTTIHAPHHDLNMASLNPAAASTAQKEVEKCLEIARMMGSTAVTFHPGSFRLLREKAYDVLKANLQKLDAKADGASCLLCLENEEPGNYLCQTGDELANILEGLGNIFVTLDLAHALARGGDIQDFIDKLGPKIRHAHISGFDVKESIHLPLGEGKIRFGQALSALRESGYDGYFVLEGVLRNPQESLPKEVALLDTMLKDAGFKY